MQVVGTIVITDEDIKEIRAGGCVTKGAGGNQVNIVFD
jgi:hypothetical protein